MKISFINERSDYDDTDTIQIVLHGKKKKNLVTVVCVGYGDDVLGFCSQAWINEQETLETFEYEGKTDFDSLYELLQKKGYM